jgi:hypothetical protein
MCRDVNECLTNNGGCSGDLTSHCTNLIPRFVGDRTHLCGSDAFLDEQGDPFYGEGVFPCQRNNGGCETSADSAGQPFAVCTDTSTQVTGPVEVTCRVRSGFRGNGVDAFDIDECETREWYWGPKLECANLIGSAATYCPAPLVPKQLPYPYLDCELPDRCGNAPCFPGAACTTIAIGASATYSCGACPSHMSGDARDRVAGCACDPGYANANGTFTDGCEAHLPTELQNCGAVGNVCPSRANALRTCTSGSCGYVCAPGFVDPDGLASTGCETMLANCR